MPWLSKLNKVEMLYNALYSRELIKVNGKIYLKDINNYLYFTENPYIKIGTYVNNTITLYNKNKSELGLELFM